MQKHGEKFPDHHQNLARISMTELHWYKYLLRTQLKNGQSCTLFFEAVLRNRRAEEYFIKKHEHCSSPTQTLATPPLWIYVVFVTSEVEVFTTTW